MTISEKIFKDNKTTNLDVLKNKLTKAGVNFSLWGTGHSKTIEHLQREIDDHETTLITDSNGDLMRKIDIVCSTVYYMSDDNRAYRLIEEKQVFKCGRERKRDSTGPSVFEKMKPGENPRTAMIRGIYEELGISGEINLLETGTDDITSDSKSYPGLRAKRVFHMFKTILSTEQFCLEGYIEEQPDKTTYFIWKLEN